MDDIQNVDNRLSNCLFFSSSKLARVIGKTAEDEFRITGLSPSYAFLISIVNKDNGIHQKKIGEMLHMTPSTITRFIDKLEGKGLLVRKIDGKNVYVYSTEKSMLLQADISKAWKNLHKIYSDMLTAEESEQFFLISNKLISKLEEKS